MNESIHPQDDPNDGAPADEGNGHSAKWILMFFALAVIGLVAIQFFMPHNAGNQQGGIGDRLPDLQLQPLTGNVQPVSLKLLAGKVVLLDFWGTWCPPCRAEFPHIVELGAKYRYRPDFQLLAVSCGEGEDDTKSLRQPTESFLAENKLDAATYFDPQGFTRQQLDKVAGFEGYPTTLVLDRKGIIRGLWVGYEPGVEQKIGDLVAKLLADPPAK
ncbi:MAG TPA: TlpA disulfide reductase family protein [Pirellulales bacterium]|nr:TlpA disulfide reductase family protein [Pirellulales bacterium]